MRIRGLAPFAAILLAACGGGDDPAGGEGRQAEAAGGGDEAEGMSSTAIASEAERLVQPRPGEYRTTVELIDFNMPGMPESMKQQMRATMGASLTQSRDFCLTPEEAAANGPREMAENLAQSNCKMDRFNVSGNRVVADLTCAGADGAGSGTMRMEGEMNAEGSVMTMALNQQSPGGPMEMTLKVTSERTGECS